MDKAEKMHKNIWYFVPKMSKNAHNKYNFYFSSPYTVSHKLFVNEKLKENFFLHKKLY